MINEKIKIELPEISDEILNKLAARIKPVVTDERGQLRYIDTEGLSLDSQSFLWDHKTKVTREQPNLKIIGSIKTLHTWAYYGFFKPTIKEVISQIPDEVIDKVVAFETFGPTTAEELNRNQYLLDKGFHVAKTLLYGEA